MPFTTQVKQRSIQLHSKFTQKLQNLDLFESFQISGLSIIFFPLIYHKFWNVAKIKKNKSNLKLVVRYVESSVLFENSW